MQEELGDGQTGPGHATVGGVDAQIDRGQPGDSSQVAVGRPEVTDQCHRGGVGRAVTEGGDGGQPDRRVLGGVDGELQERAAGDRTGHQPEGLDQPAADRRIGRPGECTFDGERDLPRRGGGPSGKRALGEDAGELPAHDDPDQPADGVEAWQPGLERPAGVLAQERPGVRQQLGEDGVGAVVEHLGKRMDGRHRGQFVILVDHRGEQPHRFRSALGAGGGGEAVPAAQHVHHEGCLLDLVQGLSKEIGHVAYSAPGTPSDAESMHGSRQCAPWGGSATP